MTKQSSAMGRLIMWVQGRKSRLFLATLVLGMLGALGQAPFGMFLLALAGLGGGYALILKTKTAKSAAFVGWALGTGYFAASLTWITQPFLVELERYGWMAPFALVLMGAGLALFWGLASGVAFRLARGRHFWLVWAAAMGLAELLRGVIFTGFPWNGLGAFWIDTPLIGILGLIGASGLGFLTFLFIASFATTLTLQDGRRRTRRFAALAVIVALITTLGFSIDRQKIAPRQVPVALRLIQPNAPQHLKWHPDYVLEFLERSIQLTGAAPEAGGPIPDIVIWPESSVPYLLHDAAPVFTQIAEAAGTGRVILGIQRAVQSRYYTSMVVLDPAGQVADLYDKHHLVPFGEYIPGGGLLNRWFGLRGFAAQNGFGYSPGSGPQILDLGQAGKILPLICYEAIFPRNLRGAPERADWVVQITNDAWFGSYSGPQQHLVQARLRAAEFGLPVVRAANTGISAVIDARGHIVAQLGLNETGFVDADLPAALPVTIYARMGDMPLALLLIGFILLGASLRRRNNV